MALLDIATLKRGIISILIYLNLILKFHSIPSYTSMQKLLTSAQSIKLLARDFKTSILQDSS